MKKLVALALLPLWLAAFAPQAVMESMIPKSGGMKKPTPVILAIDYVRAQLVRNTCWTPHDVKGARSFRATFRIYFDRDGHFLREPQLIEPAKEPANDPPLQLFVQRARTALEKCNAIGFRIPEEFVTLPDRPVPLDIWFAGTQ